VVGERALFDLDLSLFDVQLRPPVAKDLGRSSVIRIGEALVARQHVA
jgi:hypothetical protein